MLKFQTPAQMKELTGCIEAIGIELKKRRMKSSDINKALLLTEEILVLMIAKAPENSLLRFSINCRYGSASIRVSAPGDEIELNNIGDVLPPTDLVDKDVEADLRNMLLRAFAKKFAYSRRGNINYVRITAGREERVFAIRTAVSLGLALLIALPLRTLLPQETLRMVLDYFLLPIQTIFLNALTLVTAPAVFFSIMTVIGKYAAFSDPGKIGLKIMGGYAFTSILAVILGRGVFSLIRPGAEGILSYLVEAPETAAGKVSVLDTITGIIPSNIIEPFLNTNASQLIFLALLCGLALGKAGRYSEPLKNLADALDTLSTKVMDIISGTLPLATFFTTIVHIFVIGPQAFESLAGLLGAILVGLLCLMLMYTAMITVFAGISPLPFLRKYIPEMRSSFLAGSSLNAIPQTLRCCQDKLGIAPELSSFSIPLGAVANLDGNCIYLTLSALFMAKLCGVTLFEDNLIYMIFMVVIISVGSPISPGSVILALAMLMKQTGISIAAISLLFGINAFIEMMLAMCNTAGDVAISLIIARSEKKLDMDQYRA